ncbi:LytR family transcriptional regulator [Apilactobacillus timberlakei]|uniref:LCP family protein n=1 Tax=Apilactobacillus timberlakei TaxID=2008380 RepID=UPI00112D982B|nr:LCP family protein [Apilactobacillus timberlakei]TPR22411.1 LytR family transcriptional regulator [Apilactobacillus timberlakei]
MQNNNDKNKAYSRTQNNQPHFKKKKHRGAWIAFFIFLILLVLGLIFAYNVYTNMKSAANKAYEPGVEHKERNVSNVIAQNKPVSILLLGTDTGALGRNDTGRTDTMILATVNPKSETIHLTSIPRDTKVTVPGDSQPYEKINAAYSIGGASSAVQTVQNLLNVPIDFFAIINMGGLEQMVNAVGGVTVTPPLTFKYGNANVVKGQTVTLNGAQALDYSRMRHQDPAGDYGRQTRQRQVLQKLVIKGMNISSFPRYKEILNSISGKLKTDMKFDDMVALRERYGDATHHIKSQTLQGESAMVNGVDYEVPTQQELLNVSNDIRKTLGLSTSRVLNNTQDTTSDNSANSTSDNTNNTAATSY